jgi:DNA-binding transcriptional MerR regulator
VELLTLQDIANRLDMAPSTVRYYRNKYKEFMPEVAAGRFFKYQPEAVEIIKLIAAATAATQQQQQIKELLSAKYPLNIEQNDNEQSAATTAATTATTQQQQTEFTSKDSYKLIAALRDEIFFLRDQVNQLQNDNRRLTEKLLQLPAPDRRAWWQRLGRNKNGNSE